MTSSTTVNLHDHTVRGGVWTLITRPVLQGVTYVVSVALARLLSPTDFGLVGMATVFTGFTAVFIDFGIGSAIIQQRDLTGEQLNAAFRATVVMGAALSLLAVLAAPAVALFYHRAQLIRVIRVSGLGFFAASIGVVPRALMQRRLEIKRLVLLDLGPNVAVGGLSVVLALTGAGLWALVVPPLVSTFATSLLPLMSCRWRPSRRADLRALRPLLRMSLHLLGFNIINYWARNVDNLLLGRVSGERVLGFYARAYSLMMLPMSQIGGVFSGVTPALARMQDDPLRAKRAFMRVEGMIAGAAFPAMVGLAIVAFPFVQTVYGSKWMPMAPLLQILAIVGALQSVVSPTGWIYVSQGRTDVMSRWGLGASLVTISTLSVGAIFGSARAMALAYLVVNVLLFFPALMISGRLIGIGFRDIVAMLFRPALCSIVMAVVVFVVRNGIVGRLPGWTTLAVLIGVGIVSYLALATLVRLPALKEIGALRRARGDSNRSKSAEASSSERPQ